MPFGLTLGTERATALQNAIQNELRKRGYSTDADFVMAEYITIMIINNKTPEQINYELEDLIGAEYDRNFTEWLFAEVAKGAPDAHPPPPVVAPQRQPEPAPSEQIPHRDPPPHLNEPSQRRQPPPGPRSAPLYQQAISQALPSGTKRPASARSPSPSGHVPNKARRTDLPAGPRAMFNRESGNNNGSRSLLERVGPRGGAPLFDDSQQVRFDVMGPGNFPNGMGGMDMSGMAAMGNPIILQEMMMNQMALMAQMAGAMGMVNPGQFINGMNPSAPGFPDMNMMNGMNGVNGFMPQQPQQQMNMQAGVGRGRATGRGGSNGRGRGRGASNMANNRDMSTGDAPTETTIDTQPPSAIVAPQPTPAVASPDPPVITATQTRTTYVPPERPQSPTLCKFGFKCTNASCRYSHPSPVATAESGVVLSNDPCEQGKDCKDKDCIKAHVSPAVLNPKALEQNRPATAVPHAHAHTQQPQIPCRYGLGCTRIYSGCPYSHPQPKNSAPCRFGAACTRANCTFQHPGGRVLPTSFHRGLGSDAPNVSLVTPQPGSIGAPSPHRSLTISKEKEKDELQRRVRELEEKKAEAQKKVNEAEAAAAAKKEDGAKAVAIAV